MTHQLIMYNLAQEIGPQLMISITYNKCTIAVEMVSPKLGVERMAMGTASVAYKNNDTAQGGHTLIGETTSGICLSSEPCRRW